MAYESSLLQHHISLCTNVKLAQFAKPPLYPDNLVSKYVRSKCFVCAKPNLLCLI